MNAINGIEKNSFNSKSLAINVDSIPLSFIPNRTLFKTLRDPKYSGINWMKSLISLNAIRWPMILERWYLIVKLFMSSSIA